MAWQDYTNQETTDADEEEIEVEAVYEPEDTFLPKEDDLDERSSYDFGDANGEEKATLNCVSMHLDSDTANIVNAICNAIAAQKSVNVNLTLNLSEDTKEFLQSLVPTIKSHNKAEIALENTDLNG